MLARLQMDLYVWRHLYVVGAQLRNAQRTLSYEARAVQPYFQEDCDMPRSRCFCIVDGGHGDQKAKNFLKVYAVNALCTHGPKGVPILRRIIMAQGRGVGIATLLSVLSTVPCLCARLTCFLHPKLRKMNPKLRKINAVLITLKPITPTLRYAVSALKASYSVPQDILSRVRLQCFLNDMEEARALVEQTKNPIAAYHLARQFEDTDQPKEAIYFFTIAKSYRHAIMIAKDQDMVCGWGLRAAGSCGRQGARPDSWSRPCKRLLCVDPTRSRGNRE